MNKKIFWVLLFWLTCFLSRAQQIGDHFIEQAIALKHVYNQAELAITQSQISYTFYYDPDYQGMAVKQKETTTFLSLKSNATYNKRIHYDDNSFLNQYEITSSRGKKYEYDKYCGHYNKEGIFYSDAQLCAFRLNFTIPGEKVYFTAEKIYKDPKYLTQVFLQEDLPVHQKQVVFHIPEWAAIEIKAFHLDQTNVKKEKRVDLKPGHISYIFNLKEIEAIPDQPHMPGYLHFVPHLLVLSKSFQINGKKFQVLSSTADLYQWYYELNDQVSRETEELASFVQNLVLNEPDTMSRIKLLFYWVQDHIKYIAFENGLAGYQPQAAREVFHNRYGDCKGMANLLKEMLCLAGFDARLTWVGTNQIPYSYRIPSLAVDNHMICTLFLNGRKLILDPTEKFQPFGLPAERIQGKEIIIENGTDYLMDSIPYSVPEENLEAYELNLRLEALRLIGEGKFKARGESHKLLQYFYHQSTEKDKYWSKTLAGSRCQPEQFQLVTNPVISGRNKPFDLSFTCQLNDMVNQFGQESYLSLDHQQEFSDLLMDQRKVPFDFGQKVYKKTWVRLKIPEHCSVHYLPSKVRVSNEDFQFELHYQVHDKYIVYEKLLVINNPMLHPSSFARWDRAIALLNTFYNDQIILQHL